MIFYIETNREFNKIKSYKIIKNICIEYIMNFDIYIIKNYVYCISLKYISIELLSFILPKLLFYTKPKIFHYHNNTIMDDQMIIISDDCYDIIKPIINANTYIIKYNMIQLMNMSEYINDIGVISKISSIFCNQNIPIQYFTTLENNYILFEHEYYNKTLTLLSTLTNNIIIEK